MFSCYNVKFCCCCCCFFAAAKSFICIANPNPTEAIEEKKDKKHGNEYCEVVIHTYMYRNRSNNVTNND